MSSRARLQGRREKAPVAKKHRKTTLFLFHVNISLLVSGLSLLPHRG
jgi:hypothetical protein